MPNWKPIKKTYLYDGTFDGLLTIVFDSYLKKTIPLQIIPEKDYVPNFLDNIIWIKTDLEKAKRVFHGIEKNISYPALYHSYYAFLCNSPNKEISIVKYLYHGFQAGSQIDTLLSIDYVFQVHAMKKKALGECHRLKGLLRFIELESGIYYASIHPDHSILEPLGHHFMRRLEGQNFLIHDKTHNLAFLYNTKEYQIVDEVTSFFPKISHDEKKYQELWKTFFETISIKDRKNSRLQMQYMPKKYWQDLIEMQNA